MYYFLSLFVSLQLLLLNNGLFAEDPSEAPASARDQGLTQTLVMIGIALVFFYLILWRPEQKRRKALEAQRSGLKKGDRVTAMGILGTVVKIQEHTVILKMIDGAKIEFLKGAISDVLPATEEEMKNDESSQKKIASED